MARVARTARQAQWAQLAEQAKACQACPLWQGATQTVFGEGPVAARLMLVGEQPGDREDLQGHPFVGPAGRLLDEALEIRFGDVHTVDTRDDVRNHLGNRLRGIGRLRRGGLS